MTTQFHSSRANDNFIAYTFITSYADDSFNFDEIAVCVAKTNFTDISCDSCSADFNLATPFYTIDHSVAFCLSHVPAPLLNEITLPL